MRSNVNDSQHNPYSPPSIASDANPLPNEASVASKARPLFRVVAGLLALAEIWVGASTVFPLAIRGSIFGALIILFGGQFAFVAITGRWLTFSGKQ